jgi:very-short-patch-repair endonuclease
MGERKQTARERAEQAYAKCVFTRSELVRGGMTGRQITASVRAGLLMRVRRDRYAVAQTSDDVIESVRVGGRLSCLSLLRSMGVFVHECEQLHIEVLHGASRIRTPRAESTRVHWCARADDEPSLHAGSLTVAVRESIRCQTPRAAVATLDSVLHRRLMTLEQVEQVFAGLPARFSAILRLVDPSAESGQETFMRLILRGLGVRFETQVHIPMVGRVDFVVDGWLIIECDSKEFHEGWDKQVDDRSRDIAAAGQGYVTVRPLASDIMKDPEPVRRALAAVIDALGGRARR